MSTSGISASTLFNNLIPGYQCTRLIQQNFQQLGQDIQSGNVSAAQSAAHTFDFLLPQLTTDVPADSNSPLVPALKQLSQDLQAGNLSAAQQDYSTVEQYFQEGGIACDPSQPGGNTTMTGVLHQLFSQLSNALDPSGLGLISRPQIMNIMQVGAQTFGQRFASYTAQSRSQTDASKFSQLA